LAATASQPLVLVFLSNQMYISGMYIIIYLSRIRKQGTHEKRKKNNATKKKHIDTLNNHVSTDFKNTLRHITETAVSIDNNWRLNIIHSIVSSIQQHTRSRQHIR